MEKTKEMGLNFSFNTKSHDFWAIYESIRKYYPIGLERKAGRGIYFEFPGIKKLEEMVIENVHDNKNFQERWVKFTEEIGRELDKEIIGTTYGQAPSFSSSVIISREQIKNCIYTKELHFSVSFIGDYFQIYGMDRTTILEDEGKGGYSTVNVVTTSPFSEYKEPYEHVEKKLREKYVGYKIVPFGFGQTIINGLEVSYIDDENCTINQALFNYFLGRDRISRSTRGNKYYGEFDWQKK